MKNGITKLETDRLADLKTIIKRGSKTFIEVGNALEEIRDERLYRDEYDTFEAFCKAEFGFDRTYASRLISSASVTLLPVGNKIQNERQARELAKVEPERREAVMDAVVASGKPITAKNITKAAKVVDAVRLDSLKNPIPEKLLPMWDRAESEASEGMAIVSKLKVAMIDAQESDDVIYREMNFSATITNLKNTFTDMKRIKPFSVCYVCHGLRSEKCEACKGRGFYSKFFYDMCVPEEFK